MSVQTTTADEGSVLELAAAAHLTGITFGADKTTFGATVIGLNLADLVTEHGAVVGVRQAGGPGRQTWQTVARLAVEVYADTYADAWAAQTAIEAHLRDQWRPTPPGALRIDSWRNESAATRTMSPPHFLLVSTWRITSRDL